VPASPRRSRIAEPDAPAPAGPGLGIWYLVFFAAALLVRILFWRATPDRGWPHSAWLKGDALLWLEYARALRSHAGSFEMNLPIHPPGAAYLVATLWDGHAAGMAGLKAAWCVMGAVVVVLLARAVATAFGREAGLLAGALGVCWTSLLVLSTSVGSETPYLVLATAALALLPEARTAPSPARLALWSAVNGLACLFRVEHVIFWGPALAVVAWRGRREGRRTLVTLAAAAGAFVLVLLPWHVKAWRALASVNDTVAPAPLESLPRMRRNEVSAVRWEEDASRLRGALPGYARDTAAAFVAATVAHRGRDAVTAADFAILDEAFGARPRPLPRHPFVSAYGPLNFALASHRAAAVGFSRAALEEAPRLFDESARYPEAFVAGLPPPDLALSYPPHAALFVDGYAIGGRWLAAAPRASLRRAALRVARSWTGAASGLTGYGLPGGLDGTRPMVDQVVPSSLVARGWEIALVVAALAGAVLARSRPALPCWLLFLAGKLAVGALFFGYARLGTTAAPVVVGLLAVLLARGVATRGRGLRAERVAAVLVGLAVVVEIARAVAPPAVTLNGQPAGPRDPVPANVHQDDLVQVRWKSG
jgi:hypothetical protein